MRGQGSIPLKRSRETLPMAVEVVVFTSAVAPSGVNIGDFATFLVSGHVTPGCGLSRDKLVFVVF